MALAVGLLIGLALGLTGAGGSLVAVPLLILLLDMNPAEASGLALGGVLVGALAGILPNLLRPSGRQAILLGPGLILLGVGALFAPMGRWLAPQLSDVSLMLSFAGLSVIIAISMWRRASQSHGSSQTLRAGIIDSEQQVSRCLCPLSETTYFQWRPKCILALSLGGALVGILSGLYGVGGGFLIVPVLLVLSGVAMPVAVMTSLLVIAGVSSVGFITWLQLSENIYAGQLLQIALGSAAGMWLATLIGRRMAGPKLQKTFALVVVVLSAVMLLTHF